MKSQITKLIFTNHMIRCHHPNLILYKKISDNGLPFNPFYYNSILKQTLNLIENKKRFELIPPEHYLIDSENNHWLKSGDLIWRPNVITSVSNSYHNEYNPIEILKGDRYFLDEEFKFYPSLIEKIDDKIY